MTAPPTLHWNMLRWDFDMEHVDVMLGHNVEYIGQCESSQFWCWSAQKEATWRGGHAKQNRNMAFSGGKHGWNWLKFLQKNPDSLAHHFHRDSLPRTSGAMSKHPKTLCPGWEVARFGEAAKREQWGNNLTLYWKVCPDILSSKCIRTQTIAKQPD